MGKMRSNPLSKKKKTSQYMNRTQAVRKLQVSLKDFRRLCILKGIYPREPKKKGKAGNRTYYYTKDIMYLAHEPVINKFREFKIFLKRYSKAVGRGEKSTQKRLRASRPSYQLDHVVKERYPNFADALEDMDDALCLTQLFATLPQTDKIPAHRTRNCKRLGDEFHRFVSDTKALTKVFVSVKGIYYQARLMGKDVTWLVPHKFSQELPADVDYAVMLTFLEFYEVLMHFINLRLYKQAGLFYPPEFDREKEEADGMSLTAVVMQKAGGADKALGSGDDDDGADEAADDGGDDDEDEDGDDMDEEEMAQRAEAVEASMSAIVAKEKAAQQGADENADEAEEEDDDAYMGNDSDVFGNETGDGTLA